eukprot:NODE_4_length_55019_cov_0.425091.p7 type:complete len:506 gc:universal NODE_4_length_55019_cov_0.425091:11093-9576(-)
MKTIFIARRLHVLFNNLGSNIMLMFLILAVTIKTAIFRIIGNDLPPRHSNFQTLKNVKHILNYEQNSFPKYFILNRIINGTVGKKIKSWILARNHTVIEIKFEPGVYNRIFHDYDFHISDILYKSKNQSLLYKLRIMDHIYKHKNMYVMNNNGGRNAAVKIGRQIAEVTLPLDGNIFLPDKSISYIKKAIHEKQADYYLLSMERKGRKCISPTWSEEPQLVFTRNASLLFNENMRYGRRSKLELLWRLNILRPLTISTFPFEEIIQQPIRHSVQYAGHVHRLSSGQGEPESSRHARNLLRLVSIQEMLDNLDSVGIIISDYDCRLRHYMIVKQHNMNCRKILTAPNDADSAILYRHKSDFSPYVLDVDPSVFRMIKPLVVCESIAFDNAIVSLDYFHDLLNDAFTLKRYSNAGHYEFIEALSDYHFSTIYDLASDDTNSVKLLYILLKSFQYLENKRAFIRVVNAIPFRLIGQDCRHIKMIREILPILQSVHPVILKYIGSCKIS